MRALSARGLGQQYAGPRQRRRVVLNHLHIHHRDPGTPCESKAIAGADDCIGGRLEYSSGAARGHDHCLCPDRVQGAGLDIQRHDADATTIFND